MTKKVVSQADFEKEVEKEICHLRYFEYMKIDEARKRALDTVSKGFEVKDTEKQ